MASIRYAGEVFQGYNKPKRTPGEDKKFAVLVKDDDGDDKIVRFGDPSMENYRNGPDGRGGHGDEERRADFRSRLVELQLGVVSPYRSCLFKMTLLSPI
jgi:hypothetical protein